MPWHFWQSQILRKKPKKLKKLKHSKLRTILNLYEVELSTTKMISEWFAPIFCSLYPVFKHIPWTFLYVIFWSRCRLKFYEYFLALYQKLFYQKRKKEIWKIDWQLMIVELLFFAFLFLHRIWKSFLTKDVKILVF